MRMGVGPSIVRPGEGRSFPGIIFKTYARDSGGAFSIVEHPYAPRMLVPPHVHEATDQVTYVVEGTVGVRLGDEEFLVEQGSYVVKPRGTPHTHWNPSDKAARVIEVSAPGSFEGFFEGVAEILSQPNPDRPRLLSELGSRFATTFLMDWVPDMVMRHDLRLMGS